MAVLDKYFYAIPRALKNEGGNFAALVAHLIFAATIPMQNNSLSCRF